MKILIRIIVLILFCTFVLENQTLAQVLIAPETGDPHPSAALEIRSETGGLMIPTIELTKTVEGVVATNIPSPADGLLIFHNGLLDAGGNSDLPKGLWYFDATEGLSGKWMIYSRVGSVYSSSLSNFGEMFETHDMGSGTPLTVNDVYSIPWASAEAGYLGPGFDIDYDASVPTEQSGTFAVADQLFVIGTYAAYYTADVSTTLTTGTSGNIISGQLFVNNVPETAIFFRHAFQASGEYVNCSTSGIIILEPNDRVDFRFMTSSASEQIYIEHLNLKLTRIGDYVAP